MPNDHGDFDAVVISGGSFLSISINVATKDKLELSGASAPRWEIGFDDQNAIGSRSQRGRSTNLKRVSQFLSLIHI